MTHALLLPCCRSRDGYFDDISQLRKYESDLKVAWIEGIFAFSPVRAAFGCGGALRMLSRDLDQRSDHAAAGSRVDPCLRSIGEAWAGNV